MQLVHEQMQPAGVTLLGIDVRDDAEAARDVMRDRGITYPSIFDVPGRSLTALRGFPRETAPSTILLNRQHRVAAEPAAVPPPAEVSDPDGAGAG